MPIWKLLRARLTLKIYFDVWPYYFFVKCLIGESKRTRMEITMSSNSSGKNEKTKLNFLILKAALVISHGNNETHHLMLKMKFKKSGTLQEKGINGRRFSVIKGCVMTEFILVWASLSAEPEKATMSKILLILNLMVLHGVTIKIFRLCLTG